MKTSPFVRGASPSVVSQEVGAAAAKNTAKELFGAFSKAESRNFSGAKTVQGMHREMSKDEERAAEDINDILTKWSRNNSFASKGTASSKQPSARTTPAASDLEPVSSRSISPQGEKK